MLENLQTVGVDMGYGWAKIWSDQQYHKFPAVISWGNDRNLARVVETFKTSEIPLDVEVVNETTGVKGHFFIGDLAVREGEQPTYMWSKNKAADDMSLACLATSLALVANNEQQDFYVITGLPVAHFGTQLKQEYEKALKGSKFTVKFLSGYLEKQTREIRILAAKVLPQGYGAYLDQLLNANGNVARTEYLAPTGIIDIGFKTTDIVYVNDMQPIDRSSFPLELGMSWAYEQLQRQLNATYDIQKSLEEIEEIFLNKKVRIHREYRDITPWIETACRALTGRLRNEIARKWANITDLENIVIAGGGGVALFEYLDYPQKILSTDAQFANARGFWKAGKRITGGIKDDTENSTNNSKVDQTG
ncbi:MAG: ParM/StbA family protein [Thermoanaerobacteraceae bacterium]|nr:ParM/StbA family protein [Thermoanaerobacteraceae bacterium]